MNKCGEEFDEEGSLTGHQSGNSSRRQPSATEN